MQPKALREYWAKHRRKHAVRTRTTHTHRRLMRDGRRTMHHKKKMTFSVAVIAGLAPIPIKGFEAWQQGQGYSQILRQTLMAFTGWDFWNNNWQPRNLAYGLAPAVAGVFTHKLANRLGLNRMIAEAGIPLIRI